MAKNFPKSMIDMPQIYWVVRKVMTYFSIQKKAQQKNVVEVFKMLEENHQDHILCSKIIL